MLTKLGYRPIPSLDAFYPLTLVKSIPVPGGMFPGV